MARMKDADLRELVAKRRDASFKHVSGELERARKEALQFYRGDNLDIYGDSGAGLSTVVSRDTMEAIESMMPSLVKPFVSGDEVVRFEPTGPEDEEGAKQATEYVNYVFANHNDPFRVIYDSVKDGLIARYGVAKVVHERVTQSEFTRYRDLDELGLLALEISAQQDDTLSLVGDVEEGEGGFSVQVREDTRESRFRVIVLPPEQFLYEDRIATLDDATFLAHHAEKTVGDLIAMGLPKAKCMALKAGRPDSMEEDERHRGEDDAETLGDDDLARRVWVDECYVRVDYEGDGTLRWRKVILGGSDNALLLDEETDDHPFEGWTPIPVSHKLVGMSIADLTRDIQMQATAIKREALNALYLSNRPMREVVESQVNMDDAQTPAVGGWIRVKQVGQIREVPNGGEGVMNASLAMLEALNNDRESRTGVTRYNQGMDSNSLNKTATGVSIITNAAMQRQEMVARQYAEGFLKGVFRKLLGLVTRHQDKTAVIRLRGEWVEMDPQGWRTGYDMSVAVGLGTGNKDQQVAHLTNLLNIQREVAQGQGGLDGPLVTWENLHETLTRLTEAMGLKGSERYFGDPSRMQQQAAPEGPPAPDPTVIAKAEIDARAKVEAEEVKAGAQIATAPIAFAA